jgi:anthranilate phosphoribosyltransferase
MDLDEITITGPTRIAEVREGQVHSYEVTPEEFGLQRATLDDISGGDAALNAALIRDVLGGKNLPAATWYCSTPPPPWWPPDGPIICAMQFRWPPAP